MPRPKTRRTPRPPKDLTELGERLKQIRRRRGLSQAELGKKLGLSQRAISDYEIGRNRIPSNILLSVVQTLKVPLKEFTNGSVDNDTKSRKVLKLVEKIESLPPRKQKAVMLVLEEVLSNTAA